jgi:sugar phosphate isomerase/epimerase
MKYSITLASFRKVEPIEKTLLQLASQGYDAVEMYGEPQAVDVAKLKDVLGTCRLPVCGVTGMWGAAGKDGWKRKLLSSDQSLVQASKKYVQDCVKMCNSLGGEEINICLFADDLPGFDRTHSVLTQNEKEQFARRAAPILEELCRFAKDHGVKLVLEPLNRYSTPYCSTAKDAVAIAKQVSSDSLGILLDTFHMNIEEDSFESAIRTAGRLLKHTHFADNNRKMPGSAHIDFTRIMRCMQEVGYNGYASFEPNIADWNYEATTKGGLEFVKRIELDLRKAAAA